LEANDVHQPAQQAPKPINILLPVLHFGLPSLIMFPPCCCSYSGLESVLLVLGPYVPAANMITPSLSPVDATNEMNGTTELCGQMLA